MRIVDRFRTTDTVKRWPHGADIMFYYVLSLTGNAVVARAVLQLARGSVTEVLVYHQASRRRGIASTLCRLVESEVGKPLVPSRIRSRGGQRVLGESVTDGNCDASCSVKGREALHPHLARSSNQVFDRRRPAPVSTLPLDPGKINRSAGTLASP